MKDLIGMRECDGRTGETGSRSESPAEPSWLERWIATAMRPGRAGYGCVGYGRAPVRGALEWCLLLGSMAALGLLWETPPAVLAPWWPGCLFRHLTGLYCPGCGATRALMALMHGDVILAAQMNPFFLLVLTSLVFVGADRLLLQPVGLNRVRSAGGSARNWAVIAVAFGIARNLPWAPFSWLAPGGWTVG